MRPLDNREQRKSTGIANVRMCLKTYLGWMEGFPVSQSHGQLEWKMRPKMGDLDHRTMTLNRDTLRRAVTGVTRLTTQLADAANVVVGYVDRWQASVSNLLESLKAIVQCLTRAEIQSVTLLDRQFPPLCQLINVDCVAFVSSCIRSKNRFFSCALLEVPQHLVAGSRP